MAARNLLKFSQRIYPISTSCSICKMSSLCSQGNHYTGNKTNLIGYLLLKRKCHQAILQSHRAKTEYLFPRKFASSQLRNKTTFSRTNSTAGHPQDTIFALSSGQGKCGVAVIRVTGVQTSKALLELTRLSVLPKANKLCLTKLYNPDSGEAIDKGLVVWFQGPYSFTGEDCCEFHIHGGPAVISALLSTLDSLQGLRHAEPGDFTKRAFLNNKLDLTEVEGLGDLIHAETEAQRKQALRQMDGALSKLYETWRTRLIKCVAHVEAYIDFAEDDNIEDNVLEQAQDGVVSLLKDIRSHLNDSRCGERLRSGVQVAIVGPPNVGKSSLLNLLCQRPAAIVTPIPGTTRDVIESAVNIGGYPVVLSDTAGLRESNDVVEQEGVRRAKQRAQSADIVIMMVAATDITQRPASSLAEPNDVVSNQASPLVDGGTSIILGEIEPPSVSSDARDSQTETIIVINKSDLVGHGDPILEPVGDNGVLVTGGHGRTVCVISCKTNQGIGRFLEVLKEKVAALCGNPLAGNPSLTQARHRSNLMRCVAYLEAFILQQDLVMAAELLRLALRHLGMITGRVGVEDILNVVFQDFCIGK